MNSVGQSFFSTRKNGPVIFQFEYVSIIFRRNFVNGRSGLSSAWKIDGCLIPMSRAAWARFFLASLRAFLARAANSASSTYRGDFIPPTVTKNEFETNTILLAKYI